MKKLLGIVVLGLICQTKSLAIEMSMFLNTHLKCEMFERTMYWSNDNSVDETYEIESLSDDENPIYISFDKNFVFYSWHKRKKIYELKDEIKEYSEIQIITEGHYNFDRYMNFEKVLNNPDLELIRNPGSMVFQINRENGELVRYNIWSGAGAGTKDKFKCDKINYFSLPKEKVIKKF
jgi:hypothetical protein